VNSFWSDVGLLLSKPGFWAACLVGVLSSNALIAFIKWAKKKMQ
jgi:hypothetical protein